MTQSLLPCTYRRSRLGSLVCTISEKNGGENSTDLTTFDVCQSCSVPEILAKVSCINLSVGKAHLKFGFSGGFEIHSEGPSLDCEPIGFSNATDFQTKCNLLCPKFTAIHKDLSNEALLEIKKLETGTDKELRQAVLMVLYAYYSRHPERYGRFDVTPDFLALNLNLSVKDVVRVVAPMEERGEVKTAQAAGEPHFQYVYITAKGIENIDAEPLFNTARIRMENNISITNSQGIAVNTGDNSTVTSNFSVEARQTATEHLKTVRDAVTESALPEDKKAEVLDHVATVEDQIVKKEPDTGRVQRALSKTKEIITAIPEWAVKTGVAVQAVDKLVELLGGNLIG